MFGIGSRFKFVAHLDWSQGHAAKRKDALDAEEMLVNEGGKTAHHIRSTVYPRIIRGRNIPRALTCPGIDGSQIVQGGQCNSRLCMLTCHAHSELA